MADRYWVGGAGTWNASSTANWSASSGGAAGASAPTSVDDVFFDSNSNVGTGSFIVTVNTGAICRNFNAGLPTALDGTLDLALGVTGQSMTVTGSWYNQATNFGVSGQGTINFTATTPGQTIDSKGSNISANITFNGIGGSWILLSNFDTAISFSLTLTLSNGTFDTGGFNLRAGRFASNNANVRTFNLNNSTFTITSNNSWDTRTVTNFTFNAGTSVIIFDDGINPGTILSGGLTFYDVNFTSTAIFGSNARQITGNNTFRNLSFASPTSSGINYIELGGNQNITGTLSINGTLFGNRRMLIRSSVLGTERTLTCAAATINDTDFRDILLTGSASPLSGTRLGDCGGNSGITFPVGKTVWWNLNAGGSWNTSNAWALSEGGAVSFNNYPLAQDTVRITNIGLNAAASIAFAAAGNIVNIGSLDTSSRTNSMTLTSSFCSPNFYGDVDLGSGVTINLQSSDRFTFVGRTIRTLTTANITYGDAFATLSIQAPVGGGLRLLSNLLWNTGAGTQARILYLSGTLDLNNFSLTTAHFDSNNFATTRTLAFGTSGKIILSGTTTQMLTMSYDNLTVTGTSNFERALTSATTFNSTLGSNPTSSSQLLNINLISGSAVPTFLGWFGTINFTGSSCDPGAVSITSGGFILSTSGTYSSTTFTSGYTGSLTFNGKTINNLTKGGVGTTTTLNDAGIVSTLNLSSGTLDLNNQSITCVTFDSNNSNIRTLTFGTSGQISLTGNGTTIWQTNTATNFTSTGTFRVVSNYTGSTGTRIFNLGTLNVDFKAGSAPGGISIGTTATDSVQLTGTIRDLDLTGFTGTFNNINRNITGNFTVGPGNVLQSGSSATTFNGTSGVQLITTNGVTLDFPITFDGIGGTVRLGDNLTLGATRTITLTNGTIDLNNLTFTAGQLSSSNSNVRLINFGTSGAIVLNHSTGSTTVLSMSNATNFSFTGTSNIRADMSTPRGFFFGDSGGATAANRLNINLISGAFVPSFGFSSSFRQINFTGSTCNPGSATISCHGFTLASGGTYTSTNFTIVGSGSLTFTGKSFPTLNISASASTAILNDTGTVTTLTLTNGTLDLNGNNLIATSSASTSSGNPKNITFNNGTLTLSGSGSTVWNNTSPTGFSTTLGTGQGSISMTSASAKTFVGGGSVYNCTLNQGGAGTLTVTGSNTFINITNSVQPCQITFTASTTTNCTRFTPAGTTASKVTITSSSATRANINVSTQVLYINCTISNINADGAIHRAPSSLGNTNGGNNLDILFANITSGNGTVIT